MFRTITGVALLVSLTVSQFGCHANSARIALQRPAQPAEMNAFAPFVGSWTWTAKETTSGDAARTWSGTTKWEWALDNRCLHGQLTARAGDLSYDSTGMWTWNVSKRQYQFWMFNNWGYPREGVAHYNAADKSWTMPYRCTGLDGTNSHGRYTIKFIDDNTFDWTMTEWADALHMVKKIELAGQYKRSK